MKLLAPLLLASLFTSAPAASAHDDHLGCGYRLPFPTRIAPTLRIATPRIAFELGGGCRPRHEHRWSSSCEREWVAPLFQTRCVGYDCRRRPIFERVLVRPGGWSEARWRVCGCGARVRV